jgi:hypothetical protein
MKSNLLIASLAAAMALIASSDRARAEYFEYSSSVTVNLGTGIKTITNNNSPNVVLTTSGNDAISMLGNASAHSASHDDATGDGTDIVFGNIGVSVNANSPYQPISFTFTYALTLTDYNSATGGSIQGTGTIQLSSMLGDSIGGGKKVNLNSLKTFALTPANGIANVGSSSYGYLISPNSYTPPGPDHMGSFGAHVSLALNTVPEPGSWASLSIGLTGLVGLFFRRRLRRQAD